MENQNTVNEVINQMKKVEKSSNEIMSCLAGIDLLLASNDYGKTKYKNISEDYSILKGKIENVDKLTQKFISQLENECR